MEGEAKPKGYRQGCQGKSQGCGNILYTVGQSNSSLFQFDLAEYVPVIFVSRTSVRCGGAKIWSIVEFHCLERKEGMSRSD